MFTATRDDPGKDDPGQDDAGKIARWVEANTGGRVLSVERQPRWRPMYFVEVEHDDRRQLLFARQGRSDMPLTFPLEHEMTFQRLLHEHGIPVPEVFGWCSDPACYVMEVLPGVEHLEGLDVAGRRKVMFAYMEQLARIHALPVAPFKAAGLAHAPVPAEAHREGLRRFEAIYRATKRRPDPFAEFGLAFARRRAVPPADRETVIVWDSGQFLREGDRLTGLIDLELGHIGDPMADLGCLPLRDTILGFGDLGELFAHYESCGGAPIDRERIRFHRFVFGMSNALVCHGPLAAPPRETDYMVNLQWTNETNLYALESIAEYLGLELPPVELPVAEPSPVAAAHAQLERILRDVQVAEPMARFELRGGFRLARHLARWEEIGREVARLNAEDIAALTGRRPADWQDADRVLEEFVLADDGARDAELVLLFNRRLRRAQALNGPAGSAIAHHHTLQAFP